MPCPLPPLWGGACGRFGWPHPACVGQCVLQRYGMVAAACWQECHRYVLVTIQNMMLLFSPCKRCPCPCSDAVLRSCEEALAGIILHRPPSLWFVWVRSGCAGPLGAGAARGPGAGRGGGGWGPGTREHIYIHMYRDIYTQPFIQFISIFSSGWLRSSLTFTHRAHYPLFKEYSLHHNM